MVHYTISFFICRINFDEISEKYVTSFKGKDPVKPCSVGLMGSFAALRMSGPSCFPSQGKYPEGGDRVEPLSHFVTAPLRGEPREPLSHCVTAPLRGEPREPILRGNQNSFLRLLEMYPRAKAPGPTWAPMTGPMICTNGSIWNCVRTYSASSLATGSLSVCTMKQ